MAVSEKIKRSDAEWRALLTPEQYRITRQAGTEPPFTGPYLNEKRQGVYRCAGCGLPLFSSEAKYESGSGWPSFYEPFDNDHVAVERDTSHGMIRDEVLCARCDSHLGHVFPDGPQPTGQRYCMNGHALILDPDGADGQR
jgi:peptide-methionine (R)-S-oxide reductase